MSMNDKIIVEIKQYKIMFLNIEFLVLFMILKSIRLSSKYDIKFIVSTHFIYTF